jgi:hypothetical protein
MYSEKKHQWFKCTATFDTGTSDNWISKSVVDTLELDIATVLSEQHISVTGEPFNVSDVADIVWSADGTSDATHRSRQSRFRIIDSPPFDVIFGNDLIFCESISSFNNAALILTKGKDNPPQPTQKTLLL